MDDLVVRTRTEIAKRNLERVSRLSKTLQEYQGGLAEFLTLPESLLNDTENVWSLVYEARGNKSLGEDPDEFEKVLGQLDTQLTELKAKLRRSSEDANRLRADLGTLTTKRDITTLLTQKAGQIQKVLTPSKYWDQRASCDEIFSEYVDLLGGIALRTGRFKADEGDIAMSDLFLIADRLPETWPPITFSWRSLTVPARIERNRETVAGVLRIGFPEWTIWALPLLQHEFGHVFTRWKRNLGTSAPASCSDAVLADALATLVTGPAYGCAFLLLRHDPAAVREPSDEAALRSATVLTTLRQAADDVDQPPLRALVDRLTDSWRTAVEAVGGSPAALDQALASSVCDDARSYAASALAEEGADPDPPLWAKRWAKLAEWADELKRPDGDPINASEVLDAEAPQGPLLSLLLNCAWIARVGSDGQDADPDTVDTIGKEAVKRMLELARASAGGTPGKANV